MKKLLTIIFVAGAGLMGGCASWNISPSPVLTEQQRNDQIGQYWAYQWQQIADDTDYALLLRPDSHMSMWNVFHRD